MRDSKGLRRLNSFHFFVFLAVLGILGSCGEPQKKKSESTSSNSKEVISQPQEKPENKIASSKLEAGKRVYDQYCLSCHQFAGDGVPGLNPPITESEFVRSDKGQLIKILLYGSTLGDSKSNSEYSNNMPAFEGLSDQELAEVATYIRNSFGNTAAEINASDVAETRVVDK